MKSTGAAGFVLAGGQSSRLGRDKALLPYRGTTLLNHVAEQVRVAAGSATVIGNPDRYRKLGLAVLADGRPGMGPLAGIETALSAGLGEWNLVVACDMPNLEGEWLGGLMRAAADVDCDVLMGRSASGLEPLCAVYHARALGAVSAALDAGVRKVTEALRSLQVAHFEIDNQRVTANVNTPEDWLRHRG
ncbi:MAG: molybdenum cofactor guanylyltransferase [Bryobacteraceae bacterium]